MAWPRSAKIAFIGSHSVRKSNAVHAFASTIGRAGRSVEVGREVIRDNPLGLNEGATPEAQLWVLMAQVQQELELGEARRRPRHRPLGRRQLRVLPARDRRRGSVRGRAAHPALGRDVRPLRPPPARRRAPGRWRPLHVGRVPRRDRGDPRSDPARSTSPLTDASACPASQVTADFDWWAIAERLAGIVGAPLVEGQLSAPLA